MLCGLCFLQGCLQIRRTMHESVSAGCCRPKTFLHGQAAAVGVAVFNGVGEPSILAILHVLMKTAANTISATGLCLRQAVLVVMISAATSLRAAKPHAWTTSSVHLSHDVCKHALQAPSVALLFHMWRALWWTGAAK